MFLNEREDEEWKLIMNLPLLTDQSGELRRRKNNTVRETDSVMLVWPSSRSTVLEIRISNNKSFYYKNSSSFPGKLRRPFYTFMLEEQAVNPSYMSRN